MRRILGALLAGAMAVGLSGCITFGAIDRRANTISDQVANGMNQGVLTNLARASRAEPIYFVAFNQLSASGTTDFRAGAPQFFLGPKLPAVDQIATFTGGSTYLDNQTNSNFQMSLLGSKDFYSGLMAPITLQDVDLLLHQGYARELIFYLVIDKATITPIAYKDKAGVDHAALPPITIQNDPTKFSDDPENRASFEYYIKQAMEHGLTTETYMAPDEAAGDDDSSGGGGGGGGGAPKKPKLTGHAELCYDRALVMPTDVTDIDPNSFCGVKPDIRRTQAAAEPLYVTLTDPKFPLANRPLEVEVTTRSIYGMFYYLGNIIANGDQQKVHLHHYDLTAETTVEAPLLNVIKGQALDPGLGCFDSIGYEGDHYCVPAQGADNTKRIIAILNALLALKQSNADIPNTQTVRIQQ
jgi:hypothetical protein